MDPLAPRAVGRRQRRQQNNSPAIAHDNNMPEAHHRAPSSDVEARISAAIAQRESLQGGSAIMVVDNTDDEKTPEAVSAEGRGYEYLDHTADIQLHAWGDSFAAALENVLAAMFGYMTDLATIEANQTVESFVVRGHDRTSLVFQMMQEWLGQFHESGFIPCVVSIQNIVEESTYEGDIMRSSFTATTYGEGEVFDAAKHTPGTEVKAVTFGSLKVAESADDGRWDIWVIVDI